MTGYVTLAVDGFPLPDNALPHCRQWGTASLPINGATHSITLPIKINFAINGQCTMLTADVPDIVLCPYYVGCTTTTFMIATDYETGKGYSGNGTNNICWFLIAV